MHIIPRPIVTAGIANLSETPCTSQRSLLAHSRFKKSTARSRSTFEHIRGETVTGHVSIRDTAKPSRRPTYRRPASEPPAKSRRRPTYPRSSSEPPAKSGRRPTYCRPTYRRPTPDIPARPSPRRTSQRPTGTAPRLATLQKLRSAQSCPHRQSECSLTLGSRTHVRACLPSIPVPPLFFWCFEDLGHRAEDTGRESRPKSSVDTKQIPQVGYRRCSFLLSFCPSEDPFSKPGCQLA